MEIFLAIAVIIIAVFLYARYSGKTDNSSRPPGGKLPLTEIANDKIILVDNANYEDIKKALTEFCNQYNKSDHVVLSRLWQLNPGWFAVTFPYDIDFITYCFAVNFLDYPMNVTWNAKVRGWTTTTPGDEWITDKSVNKKVMLYLAEDDKEGDNVFMTTEDNIGFKLGFASARTRKLLDVPKESFRAPRVSVSDLKDQQFEDFK